MRADLAAAEARQAGLVQEGTHMKAEIGRLTGRLDDFRRQVRTLEHDASEKEKVQGSLQADLDRIRGERNSLKGENRRLAQASGEVVAQRDAALEELGQLKVQLEEAQRQATAATQKLQSADAIRAEAVQEFRVSRVLQEDKDTYAAGFTKYGFYLARRYLEHQRPGETFPELIYGPDVANFVVPDWREYGDPDPTAPEDYLTCEAYELERPAGPWTPLAAFEDDTAAEGDTEMAGSTPEAPPSVAEPEAGTGTEVVVTAAPVLSPAMRAVLDHIDAALDADFEAAPAEPAP